MKIATYANARTALEARKGIAPAFMVGEWTEFLLGPTFFVDFRAGRVFITQLLGFFVCNDI